MSHQHTRGQIFPYNTLHINLLHATEFLRKLDPWAGQEIPVSCRTSVIVTLTLRKILCMYNTVYT